MNIELSRLEKVSKISVSLLSDSLSANEMAFICGRVYLLDNELGVHFTDEQLIKILHLFKGVYFTNIDLAELFNVEVQLLFCAFELARSLQEFGIPEPVTPNQLEGVKTCL